MVMSPAARAVTVSTDAGGSSVPAESLTDRMMGLRNKM
jgi:hypothetical protein